MAAFSEVIDFFVAEEAQSALKNPLELATVISIDEYVAVFVPGGHGIVADGPHNKKLASILAECYNAGKVVCSVCHGPCSFVEVTRADGKPIVDGKKVGAPFKLSGPLVS
jgi:putative intracellular protease/amidase